MIINKEYKKQLEELHSNPKTFNNGRKQYKVVERFLKENKFNSLLDFGCGKGGLLECIKEHHPEITSVQGYDPGYKEFEVLPSTPFECVVSTDAMEHIEPEYLDATLKTLNTLFTNYCFLRIACYPAKKSLPDGRNAHLIVEQPEWWIQKVKNFISGEIVSTEILDFHGTPKKGPPIVGKEVIIVIKK